MGFQRNLGWIQIIGAFFIGILGYRASLDSITTTQGSETIFHILPNIILWLSLIVAILFLLQGVSNIKSMNST
jgi:hypothetical protein